MLKSPFEDKDGFAAIGIKVDGQLVPVEDKTKKVRIKPGEYKIDLWNNRSTRSQIHVEIDKVLQGTWIMNPHQRHDLERAMEVARKFVARAVSSKAAKRAGVESSVDNGLVSVTFTPEKKSVESEDDEECDKECLKGDDDGDGSEERFEEDDGSDNDGSMLESYHAPENPDLENPSQDRAVATVYGEESKQQFGRAEPILDDDLDHANARTIVIRLVTPRVKKKKKKTKKLAEIAVGKIDVQAQIQSQHAAAIPAHVPD